MKINLVIILVLLSSSYGNENKKLGQTGFQFLSVSSDARSGGMADAMTTLHAGSVSLFHNPAGLSKQEGAFDFNFSSNNWIAGIKHDAFSFSYSPQNGLLGVFGFSLLNVDYGDMQGTMVWDNNQGYIDTEVFRPSAFAIGFGYGRSLSKNFSVGSHFKKAFQYLGKNVVPVSDSVKVVQNNVASSIAFDFGTIYITDWNDFTFGMSIRNFSNEVQYAYDGFQLPLTFRIGASINILNLISSIGKPHSLLLAIDALHPRSYSERLNIGIEYSFMDYITTRVGYLHNYDERSLTYGAGVSLGFLTIDYALTPFGVFDSVNRLGINISL